MYFFFVSVPETFSAVRPAWTATSRKSTWIGGRLVSILGAGRGARVGVAMPWNASAFRTRIKQRALNTKRPSEMATRERVRIAPTHHVSTLTLRALESNSQAELNVAGALRAGGSSEVPARKIADHPGEVGGVEQVEEFRTEIQSP